MGAIRPEHFEEAAIRFVELALVQVGSAQGESEEAIDARLGEAFDTYQASIGLSEIAAEAGVQAIAALDDKIAWPNDRLRSLICLSLALSAKRLADEDEWLDADR